MIDVYFDELKKHLCGELLKTRKTLNIAVAWLNFQEYKSILENLQFKGVKIKIIIGDNISNRNYQQEIDELQKLGLKIKFIKYKGIMHHKFCIIDEKICLFGSFNWTHNANYLNFENLNISDNHRLVMKYCNEFDYLWRVNNIKLQKLVKLDTCPDCGGPTVNILIIEADGENSSKVSVFSTCVNEYHRRELFCNYYDISLFNAFSCFYEEQQNMEINYNKDNYEECEEMQTFLDIKYRNYIKIIIKRLELNYYIHAVGGVSYEMLGLDKHDLDKVYKVYWKDRLVASYIDDYYDIE